jgi:shikimate dehydrogenase
MNKIIKKYAVVGHPIEHSKSPLIHQSFADEFGMQLIYERIDIPFGTFSKEVISLKKEGYLGLNVTLPYKKDAFNICNQLSDKSKLTQSVNTISFNGEMLIGNSTDGIGLVKDLIAKKVKLKDRTILLLGAGGAANGVMYDLIAQKPKKLHIFNRTYDKAKLMQKNWEILAKNNNVNIAVLEYLSIDNTNYDLVINATSSGLVEGAMPMASKYFIPETIYYDMTYGVETPFMKASKAKGAKTFDGTGMLIEQAAESFFIWHKLKPNTTNTFKIL